MFSVLLETLPTLCGNPYDSNADRTYYPEDSSSYDVYSDTSDDPVRNIATCVIFIWFILLNVYVALTHLNSSGSESYSSETDTEWYVLMSW